MTAVAPARPRLAGSPMGALTSVPGPMDLRAVRMATRLELAGLDVLPGAFTVLFGLGMASAHQFAFDFGHAYWWELAVAWMVSAAVLFTAAHGELR